MNTDRPGPTEETTRPAGPTGRSAFRIIVAGAVVVALAVTAWLWWDGRSSRHDEVAAKGRAVMPFDLDRTTHEFTKLPDGGRQTVTADAATDGTQIGLIREHLRAEAAAFRQGDFSDPMAIHGARMPGVAVLSAAKDRLVITYADVPSGATLTYSTTDPAVTQALHDWFDAQVSDHGGHARAG